MLNNPFGVSGHTPVHSSATETFHRHLEIRYGTGVDTMADGRLAHNFVYFAFPCQFLRNFSLTNSRLSS